MLKKDCKMKSMMGGRKIRKIRKQGLKKKCKMGSRMGGRKVRNIRS